MFVCPGTIRSITLMYLLERVARSLFRPPKCPCLMVRPSAADVVLYILGREPNCGLPTSMECDLQNCVNIGNSLLTRNFVWGKVEPTEQERWLLMGLQKGPWRRLESGSCDGEPRLVWHIASCVCGLKLERINQMVGCTTVPNKKSIKIELV